jgi:hypothetical protein
VIYDLRFTIYARNGNFSRENMPGAVRASHIVMSLFYDHVGEKLETAREGRVNRKSHIVNCHP